MSDEATCLLPADGLQTDRLVQDLIDEVKVTVNSKFETSIPHSALQLPEINVTVISPMIKLWAARKDPAAVFCWLSARADFLKGV